LFCAHIETPPRVYEGDRYINVPNSKHWSLEQRINRKPYYSHQNSNGRVRPAAVEDIHSSLDVETNAVGGRSVPTEAVRTKLKPEERNSFSVSIQNLKESMLVVTTKKNDQELLSITPLGVAFVRQFEEMELDKLGKKN
jgi:hypothetical protein